MATIRSLILLVLCSGMAVGDEQLGCDLAGTLKCLMSFSSTNKFTVSSYSDDPHVNPAALVRDMCIKLDELYRCVGDRILGCAPQYRLMYETAVSSGRFVCNDGKQGFIDNFRCLVSNSVRNSSISCGGKIITVIRDILSSPASVLPDLASRADELCIKSNDTLKCVISKTTEECGVDAASYIQQYMDTSIAPLKSFFACSDDMEDPHLYKPTAKTTTEVDNARPTFTGESGLSSVSSARVNSPPGGVSLTSTETPTHLNMETSPGSDDEMLQGDFATIAKRRHVISQTGQTSSDNLFKETTPVPTPENTLLISSSVPEPNPEPGQEKIPVPSPEVSAVTTESSSKPSPAPETEMSTRRLAARTQPTQLHVITDNHRAQQAPNTQPQTENTANHPTTPTTTTSTKVVISKDIKISHSTSSDPKTTFDKSAANIVNVRLPVHRITSTTTISPVVLANTRGCRKYCFRFRNSSRFTSLQKQQYDEFCDTRCDVGQCLTNVCTSECGCQTRKLVCRYTGIRRRWAGDHWCNNMCRQGSPLCRQTQCDCRYA